MILRAVLCLSLLAIPSFAASLSSEARLERGKRAQRIVRGRISAQSVEVPQGDHRRMRTISRIEVLEVLKGPPARELEVLQLGGKDGLWELKVPGDARLQVGEEAILLLRCPRPETPDRCTLLALSEGRWKVNRAAKGAAEVQPPGEAAMSLEAATRELKSAESK